MCSSRASHRILAFWNDGLFASAMQSVCKSVRSLEQGLVEVSLIRCDTTGDWRCQPYFNPGARSFRVSCPVAAGSLRYRESWSRDPFFTYSSMCPGPVSTRFSIVCFLSFNLSTPSEINQLNPPPLRNRSSLICRIAENHYALDHPIVPMTRLGLIETKESRLPQTGSRRTETRLRMAGTRRVSSGPRPLHRLIARTVALCA
ncbi:hypothetical protein F4780DRAFT_606749 [Xylariomycetidae sp. FL0641]|nr:hypothetical protein F4780DRAFT_606749 [Xylariomycetidae sp. FL0641]